MKMCDRGEKGCWHRSLIYLTNDYCTVSIRAVMFYFGLCLSKVMLHYPEMFMHV